MMKALCDWIRQLQNRLAAAEMRAPVVWRATPEQAGALHACLPEGALWLDSGGETPLIPPPQVIVVKPNQAQHHLGDEYPMLVVDGHSGVDANMLLMLAGTLTPGGIALILLPPSCPACVNGALTRYLSHGQQPPAYSPWLARLIRLPGSLIPGEPWRPPRPAASPEPAPPPPIPDKVATWLITGRRGRGKSTLLAEIATSHPAREVAVITNHSRALNSLRRHLTAQGWQPCDKRGVPLKFFRVEFSEPPRTLRILPPDAFLAQKPPCGLLLIDEAARLTLPVLRRLLQRPVPTALATTLEGYEGAGQGLRLKLARCLPPGRQLKVLTLTHSRRWAANDPLERWLDALCLLDTPMPPAPKDTPVISSWQAGGDERTLRAVWALLQTAHYQTRPTDLMQLLDRPDQRFWLAQARDGVAGVLWTLEEGGLARPPHHVRGHLAAQRLRQLTGDDTWLQRRSLRITRIAVHPGRQGEGIGTALVERLKTEADVDFLSVSCAAEPTLLTFWQKQGFELMHRGDRPNRASGAPSALLVYDLRT